MDEDVNSKSVGKGKGVFRVHCRYYPSAIIVKNTNGSGHLVGCFDKQIEMVGSALCSKNVR